MGVYDYVHSVSELGEEGASGVRGPVLFPPLPPNCRIREVHCGSQVRLVVIAIRDIAKGEEITVDYNLAEWGENALVIKHTYSYFNTELSPFFIVYLIVVCCNFSRLSIALYHHADLNAPSIQTAILRR